MFGLSGSIVLKRAVSAARVNPWFAGFLDPAFM
jgi:hypothetical protein